MPDSASADVLLTIVGPQTPIRSSGSRCVAKGTVISPNVPQVQTITSAVQMADDQQDGCRNGHHHEDLSEISHT
jgi:hypothetical protein